jgi:predicted RNA-binding protein with PIN domain
MERFDQLGRRARLLIDGYNLLHASPFLGRDRSPGWLERARQRLLMFISERLQDGERGRTVVVFDAPRGPLTESGVGAAPGVEAIFSVGFPEADDLLERWIRMHPTPKRLEVVSADRRLGVAAERRRATWIASGDWYSRRRAAPLGGGPGAKPDLSAAAASDGGAMPRMSVSGWMAYFGLGWQVPTTAPEAAQPPENPTAERPLTPCGDRPADLPPLDKGAHRLPGPSPQPVARSVRAAVSPLERPVAPAGSPAAGPPNAGSAERSAPAPPRRRPSGPDERRRARRSLSDDDLVA